MEIEMETDMESVGKSDAKRQEESRIRLE